MVNADISQHLRQEAQPAVQDLSHAIGRPVDIAGNHFLRILLRNTSSKIKSKPRYTTIWNLGVLLRHIASLVDPESLPWSKIMAIATAIFMIFVPCRTIALIRIDPSRAKMDPKGKHITVLAREKTDFGQGQSTLLFRSLPDERFSPMHWFQVCEEHSNSVDCPQASPRTRANLTREQTRSARM
jgi:hypothetical protein